MKKNGIEGSSEKRQRLIAVALSARRCLKGQPLYYEGGAAPRTHSPLSGASRWRRWRENGACLRLLARVSAPWQ